MVRFPTRNVLPERLDNPNRAAGHAEGSMTPSPSLSAVLRGEVANLYPGYFALVMATGIVSIGAHIMEMEVVARVLLLVNLVAYGVLCILFLARALLHYPAVVKDLTDHRRGPGFFTIVAGTCVVGSQLVLLEGRDQAALLLWGFGTALWLNFIYAFFTAVTVKREKPALAEGVNGSWLIAIVATQSVSILGTLLVGAFQPREDLLLFFTLCMYLLGCMLYILVITLIFYRFTFFRVEAEGLTPPYWINMGAVAITTLAGATLLRNADRWSILQAIDPFLTGFTLFFWATGTWWIPLLLILGAWRHLWQGYPFRYDPEYWGMVFPLGMYSVSTFHLATAVDLPFLIPVARGFIWIALVAWGLTFVGLARRIVAVHVRTLEAGALLR